MRSFIARTPTDQVAWDTFIRRASAPNEFLQSWQWGTFQHTAGKPITRIEVVDGDAVVAVALLVRHTTRLGKSFLLAPRGPILDIALPADALREVWRVLLDEVSRIRTSEYMFLKIEPNCVPPEDEGFVRGTGIHPEQTLLLDLTKSPDALLAEMHHKTRYNIRLSERRGVAVGFGTAPEHVDEFLAMLQATAKQQKIGIFPSSYYRMMVESLGGAIEVAVAREHTTPLAGALMVRFGKTMTYLHGASSPEHHEYMAPHLLQWQAILRARDLGCTVYDFYGIAPKDAPDHRWSGITRFKRGFGGTVHEYPGGYNMIYQRAWYFAYRIAKRAAGR